MGGVKKFMRVSPLFETRDDLINAPKVIEAAFSVPWYKQHIQGKQEACIAGRDAFSAPVVVLICNIRSAKGGMPFSSR